MSENEREIKDEDSSSDSELEAEKKSESEDSEIDEDEDGNMVIRLKFKSIHYKPTQEEKQKLANMFIELRHKVAPQHAVEKTAGTRALKVAERKRFEKYATLKSGVYTAEEDRIITKNWKAFCKMYSWDPKNPKPFLQMKFKSKEFFLSLRNRVKFVQFLADGLLDRSLYSVYNRFKVMYDPHKVKRYKQKEDAIILNYIENNKVQSSNRKFADLALILQRTRASVWRRYRLLKRKRKEKGAKDVTSC